jgi:hypothetical protein
MVRLRLLYEFIHGWFTCNSHSCSRFSICTLTAPPSPFAVGRRLSFATSSDVIGWEVDGMLV